MTTERDYTTEELAILGQHKDNLHRATYSQWCRAMSRSELQEIYDIHVAATGWNTRLNSNCASCILELLTAVGRKYYKQLERAKVEVKDVASAKTTKRAKINTRR